MKIRAVGRLGWFVAEVGVISLNYLFTVAWVPQKTKAKRLARAAWLSRAARRHLKIFGYSAVVSGPLPTGGGVLVCNHLSYMDVLAIAAVTPAVFVSKADVRRWPLFGWLATLGGTVFVARERRTHVGEVNREIESALATGALVVIFPEGTSSNGETVLPFRTALLEPAARTGREIATSWLHYELTDGDAKQEVCYWGNHTFFPHLFNLLGKRRLHATVRFGKISCATDDRKQLAQQLHAAVLELKAGK
jgi:1-acyl-sn-glycerol-3-phosphate acyltransferase